MNNYPSQSIGAVIDSGIKRPIRILLESGCHAAALVLSYSAIDMMAFLSLPIESKDVMRSDFIEWVEAYMTLPEGLTGKDLYGARCGVLRGTDSRLVREGRCRRIRYRNSEEDAVVVRVEELVAALFRGIERFLESVAASEERCGVLRERLEEMRGVLPL